MSRRVRFALWCVCVFGTLLSAALFRLAAPWAGAAWQCVCLVVLGWLYATTPPEAIRLPRWLSRVLILAGMVLCPALCYGRVTWAMAIVVAALLVLDLVHIEPEGSDGRDRPRRFRVRWSWEPGVLSDWLGPLVLWSPIMWLFIAGHDAAAHPVSMSVLALGLAMLWLVVVQVAMAIEPRPWRRSQRVGGLVALAIVDAVTVAGFAFEAGMAR